MHRHEHGLERGILYAEAILYALLWLCERRLALFKLKIGSIGFPDVEVLVWM
jgi:hypothetical protein